MQWIDDQETLAAFCTRLAGENFITVDTEFLRDKTYWPQLCLLQIAGAAEAAAIDPFAIKDFTPILMLFDRPDILKVFHAGRQDLEIFYHCFGRLPAPVFDTQIAAMVAGFGDSVSYETLAARLAGARIDKSLRFTDWSERPLAERQIVYAIADVTYLRVVYEKLAAQLRETGRAPWLAEELAILTDPKTYAMVPDEAWRRLKPRNAKPKFLNILRKLASWREIEAQVKNIPRGRILRDDIILDLAAQAPRSKPELARVRSLPKGQSEGSIGDTLLALIAAAVEMPESAAPHFEERAEIVPGVAPVVELLKVLLKLKCEEAGVAAKLVATTADIEEIAASSRNDLPVLSGWRYEVFGADALRLRAGKLAFTLQNNAIKLVELEPGPTLKTSPTPLHAATNLE